MICHNIIVKIYCCIVLKMNLNSQVETNNLYLGLLIPKNMATDD